MGLLVLPCPSWTVHQVVLSKQSFSFVGVNVKPCFQPCSKGIAVQEITCLSNLIQKSRRGGRIASPCFAAAVEDTVCTEPVLDRQNNPLITAALVKQLRDETGSGMMDCKKALMETAGDLERAREYLRKKGLASAEKKSSRKATEGRIGSYIHDNRLGVLIEVNCETDFVARGEIFRQLVDDLAMQVAACPNVRYVSVEDIPEELVKKEREIEMQKEDLINKPEVIRAKIVEGRVRKRVCELSLLEQSFIKDESILVKDLVRQTVVILGENIQVRRFNRFVLGEGVEKKNQDVSAEVASQTEIKH
eukprot:c24336_g1_i2 orf=280-1194(+)